VWLDPKGCERGRYEFKFGYHLYIRILGAPGIPITKVLDGYLNKVRINADKYENPEWFAELTLSPTQIEYKLFHIPVDGRI